MLKKLIIIVFLLVGAPVFALGGGISVKKDGGIYIFKIPLRDFGEKIRPYVAEELTTVSDVFKNEDFTLVVNGGFFDPINNLPVSTVIIDGKRVQSFFQNPEMTVNLDNQGRGEQVLGRSEFRILKNIKGDISFDIASHLAPVKDETIILHSIQAGPMIIPEFRLIEESFVKYQDKKAISLAADVMKRRERTILGLKFNPVLGDDLYIIIFTNNKRVALNEARDYCKKLGLDKAMALDGGASTSINYKDIEIYSAQDGARKVKSFLVIE